MAKVIEHADIQKGDTVRIEYTYADVKCTVEGVADQLGYGEWRTAHTQLLTRRDMGQTIYLIDRPLPPLPTEDGTIILAAMPVEEGETIPLILRNGKWWYLDGSSFYHANAVRNHEWTMAKVVEA